MRILFQGGWKENRDPIENKDKVFEYCIQLAKFIVENNHQIVLYSLREFENVIADEINKECTYKGKDIKKHLLYILPGRIKQIPKYGVVKRIDSHWWIEERTYLVECSEAVIAIGGGRGTFDCMDKACIAAKPVFIAGAIESRAVASWRNSKKKYYFFEEGDADFFEDINISSQEYFDKLANLIKVIEAKKKFSNKIFIVHGREHEYMSSLSRVLSILGFDPIVLQNEANNGLTIIEKLEKYIGYGFKHVDLNVGFAFVLYTPDDLGHLPGELEQYRARQNVVFEHGLLLGILGRDRTCAIVKGSIEIPSDFQGVIYERISDFEKEAITVIRILASAGYQIDTSKLV